LAACFFLLESREVRDTTDQYRHDRIQPDDGHSNRKAGKEKTVLWSLAVLLVVLWAVGLVTSYTMGGFVHILLVIALVVIVVRVIQGRRVL